MSSVSVSGKVVTLELASEPEDALGLLLDYTHRDDTPLKRAATGGDAVASFTQQPVTRVATATIVPVCDRTTQVRDALVEATKQACGSISEDDLAAVEELDLSESGIRSLAPGDFSGLVEMRRLNLNNNPRLRSLPQGMGATGLSSLSTFSATKTGLSGNLDSTDLAGLPDSIQFLYLSGNSITSVSANTFASLPILTDLDLGGNNITSIADNAFNGLPWLRWLNLEDNNFATIANSPFDSLWRLKWLDLSGNALTSLTADQFKNLGGLQVLKLGKNKLTTISGTSFNRSAASERLNSLLFLGLDGNLITTVDANAFQNLPSLNELNLAGNDFTSLPATVFDGLTKLDTLELGWGELNSVQENQFSDLSELRYLDLSKSKQLTSLPSGVFNGLTGVKQLQLSSSGFANAAAFAANVFSPLTALEELWLVGNPGSPFDMTGKGVRSGVWIAQDITLSGVDIDVTDGAPNPKIQLTWTHTAGASVQYRCYSNAPVADPPANGCRESDPPWTDITPTPIGSSRLFQLTQLTPGKYYFFQLRAKMGASHSPPSPWSEIYYLGTSSADTITGDTFDNLFYSVEGDDKLDGGGGGDRFFGGSGIDTVTYASADSFCDGITLDLGVPADNTCDAFGDTFHDIEKFEGTPQADTMVANRGKKVFTNFAGGAGNDTLYGAGGNDTLEGGDGDDKLYGFTGTDTLNGGAGDDELVDYGSGTTFTGGAGNDTFYFRADTDDATTATITDYTFGSTAAASESLVACTVGSGWTHSAMDSGADRGDHVQERRYDRRDDHAHRQGQRLQQGQAQRNSAGHRGLPPANSGARAHLAGSYSERVWEYYEPENIYAVSVGLAQRAHVPRGERQYTHQQLRKNLQS